MDAGIGCHPYRDEQLLPRILRLYDLYQRGEITTPAEHEVHPALLIGSRENYLYFTLACCLNFQRNSPALWQSARKTYEDPRTNYLFFPEEVQKRPFIDVQHDLTKHRLALQSNRHPAIWTAICRTLNADYDNDPRAILREADNDVRTLIRMVRHEKKDRFPYLGGRKLSNYWLFILSRFTDAHFTRLDEISIIPDTNVIKSTVRLGMAEPGISPAAVEQIWWGVAEAIGIAPVRLHPALWNWARNGFTPPV